MYSSHPTTPTTTTTTTATSNKSLYCGSIYLISPSPSASPSSSSSSSSSPSHYGDAKYKKTRPINILSSPNSQSTQNRRRMSGHLSPYRTRSPSSLSSYNINRRLCEKKDNEDSGEEEEEEESSMSQQKRASSSKEIEARPTNDEDDEESEDDDDDDDDDEEEEKAEDRRMQMQAQKQEEEEEEEEDIDRHDVFSHPFSNVYISSAAPFSVDSINSSFDSDTRSCESVLKELLEKQFHITYTSEESALLMVTAMANNLSLDTPVKYEQRILDRIALNQTVVQFAVKYFVHHSWNDRFRSILTNHPLGMKNSMTLDWLTSSEEVKKQLFLQIVERDYGLQRANSDAEESSRFQPFRVNQYTPSASNAPSLFGTPESPGLFGAMSPLVLGRQLSMSPPSFSSSSSSSSVASSHTNSPSYSFRMLPIAASSSRHKKSVMDSELEVVHTYQVPMTDFKLSEVWQYADDSKYNRMQQWIDERLTDVCANFLQQAWDYVSSICKPLPDSFFSAVHSGGGGGETERTCHQRLLEVLKAIGSDMKRKGLLLTPTHCLVPASYMPD